MIENSDQDIIHILNLLGCHNTIRYESTERYKNLDIYDKLVQYDMLDNDSVWLEFHLKFKTKIALNYFRNELKFKKLNLLLSTGGMDKKTMNKICEECKFFLEKYNNFCANQYNIDEFVFDFGKIELLIKKWDYLKSTVLFHWWFY